MCIVVSTSCGPQVRRELREGGAQIRREDNFGKYRTQLTLLFCLLIVNFALE